MDSSLELKVQFGRLDERLKSLEKKQDEHHQVVMSEMKDLREGLLRRVERVEIERLLAKDFFSFRDNEFVVLQKNVDILMSYRWKFAGVVSASIFLAPFIWSIISKKL